MSGTSANVSCTVEIYPFEGGPYTLQGGQILGLTISKSMGGNSVGQFTINLAPGGPNGTEDPVPWSRVITPMSHVIIGMTRGATSAIVMDGVVSEASEQQMWTTQDRGSQAVRAQVISGYDVCWFFTTFSFWALSFAGITAGSPVGQSVGKFPANFFNIIQKGLAAGNGLNQPTEVGRLWFTQIMGGPQGILNSTYFPYKGTKVLFSTAVTGNWENYPNVVVPLGANFMTGSGQSWWTKLKQFMSEPWYELFTATAPRGFFSFPGAQAAANQSMNPTTPSPASPPAPNANITGNIDNGTFYAMDSQPNALPAGPQLVARVNPLPLLNVAIASTGEVTPDSLDMTRWNRLPLFDFTLRPFGFIRSRINFNSQDAYNFYQINPTIYAFLNINTVNNLPAQFLYICAADANSIQRYGFKPQMATTAWFSPSPAPNESATPSVQDSIIHLTGSFVGWAHPVPLMAHATVQIPLDPSIQIGCRFRYAPFKSGESWDFYIEAFSHRFEFGGNSVTELTLTRGLPSSIYSDASKGGVLQAIITGNAQRLNGVYVKGLPKGAGPPLQFVQTYSQIESLATQLTSSYVTPQPGVPQLPQPSS